MTGENAKIINGKAKENSVPAEILDGNLLPADADDKISGPEFDCHLQHIMRKTDETFCLHNSFSMEKGDSYAFAAGHETGCCWNLLLLICFF